MMKMQMRTNSKTVLKERSLFSKWCGSSYYDPDTNERDQLTKIFYLRVLLLFSLVAAAVVCSVMSYVILHDNEMSRFETQYDSISDSALNSVADSFERMNIGLQEMASTYSYNFPNASSWPNVAWLGFQNTATKLGKISSLENMAFTPLVLPENQASFEEFAGNFLNASIPNVQAPFGLKLGQIWALDLSTLRPYHDVTGHSPYSSLGFNFTTPVLQYTTSGILSGGYLTYNLHDTSFFTTVMDQVLRCTLSDDRNTSQKLTSCGAISEAVSLPFRTIYNPNPPVEDMQALLTHPIFPAGNLTAMVGFMSGAMSWKNLLIRAVPTFVSGLDCVITTGTQTSFTYTIVDGSPEFAGIGDAHNENYDKYRKAKTLDTNVAQVSSVTTYEIAFYPRRAFVTTYTSNVPILAGVVMILVFLFCSTVFFAYDILMKREFGRKQAILDTKRRFVRFISHEIRTPLNTVRLGLKVFDLEMSNFASEVANTPAENLAALILTATENWRHLADDIATNSESAVEVLDDLLNYDKIEVGNLRLELCMFNVWELVRRATSIMQMTANEKNIRLELTCDNILITSISNLAMRHSEKGKLNSTCILGDAARMSQVLRNLITNAIKFTPAGGYVSVTATTIVNGMAETTFTSSNKYAEPQVRAGSVQISVKDSGAGLTATQLQDLCDEGVQFNASELQAGQGSGLGLYIAKGIVEQHNGVMTVASEGLGKGVTFTVELPLFAGPSSHRPSLLQDGVHPLKPQPTSLADSAIGLGILSSDSTQFSNEIKRTLVVDDSPFNRKMLVRLLTTRGYVCEQAEDGEHALRIYKELCNRDEPPDAITMDFEMPVMNGPTATKKLRELGCTCLIVGVTGNVLPEDVNHFMAQGADHVLTKPLVLETFEELLFKHQYGQPKLAAAPLVISVKPSSGRNSKGAAAPWQVHPFEEDV